MKKVVMRLFVCGFTAAGATLLLEENIRFFLYATALGFLISGAIRAINKTL